MCSGGGSTGVMPSWTDPLGVSKVGGGVLDPVHLYGNPQQDAADARLKAQQDAATARDQQIADTQGTINSIFDDPARQTEVADLVDATRQYYGQQLDRQKTIADRNLRFALAKSGMAGSSTQAYQQGQLNQDYNTGMLDVNRRAESAGANLKAENEQARSRLLALATSGLDETSAAQQAAEIAGTNLAQARNDPSQNGLGDMFVNLSQYAQNVEVAKQRQTAYRQAYTLYPELARLAGGGGY